MNNLMFVGFVMLGLGIMLRGGAAFILLGGTLIAWCVYVGRFGA